MYYPIYIKVTSMKQIKSYNPNQTYFITFNPFEKFSNSSLEMVVHNIIEKHVDIKTFLEQMNNKNKGQKAISPKILLKVIFYAYCSGIYSSRTIEEYLNNHLSFIFLADYNIIDHSTICRFINRYSKQIQQVFSKVLYICYKSNLVNLDMICIDGSKIRANAHSEWTGNKKEFSKLKDKLEQRIAKLIERQKRIDQQESNTDNLIKYKNKIERQKKKYDAVITKIDKFMNELDAEDKKNKINLVDPDSRLQKGENGKYFEGYNAQVVANEKIIISYDINNHQSDRNELFPMMELTGKSLKHLGISETKIKELKVLADAGYRNNDHMGKLNTKGYDMYIRVNPKKDDKDTNKIGSEACRILKKKGEKFLVCPGGRLLKTKGVVKEHGKNLYRFFASRGGCLKCKYYKKCWNENNKSSSKKFSMLQSVYDNYFVYKNMQRKLDSIEGKDIYNQRLGMIERVFGQIKSNRRFKKFYHRGIEKVSTIWSIVCTSYNINKLCSSDIII